MVDIGQEAGVRVPEAEQIAALLAEANALDRAREAPRLLELYAAAAALVDRSARPKQWAALRQLYGALAFGVPGRLESALAAFRDALPCWHPVDDRAAWVECRSYIGWSLFMLGRFEPPDSEEAIESLEATLADYPDGTPRLLATYYAQRSVGDRLHNWTRQVECLHMALSQIQVADDPLQWATLTNDLAVARTHEPDGDFAAAVRQRLRDHDAALAALAPLKDVAGSEAQNRFIQISLDASEAQLMQVTPDPGPAQVTAERLARGAVAACNPATPARLHALAAIGLARVLVTEGRAATAAECAQALGLCAGAAALIDAPHQPVLAATNEKFRALIHLRLMRLGMPDQLEPLLAHARTALDLLANGPQTGMRRTIARIAADATMLAGDFACAAGFLARAEQEGERALDEAQSRAGRLESIFDLHDAASLLGYCLLRTGDVPNALEAVDRNKGLLWSHGKPRASFDAICGLVPAGGALVFPVFGPTEGQVVVVAAAGCRTASLPDLGLVALRQLLHGDLLDAAGSSWLTRYVRRLSEPVRWRERIDSIGALLFERFWRPVLPLLQALGIVEGAELVVLPAAGLGALPLHAAWTEAGPDGDEAGRRWIVDEYALRYAPSARCLVEIGQLHAARGASAERNLLVSNPTGAVAGLPELPELHFCAFEIAWARQVLEPAATHVVEGAAATKAAVLADWPESTLVHLSTHGSFDVADPWRSHLVLADGEPLSLEELVASAGGRFPSRIVLSACETAVAPAWRKPDETIGFPAAFLEHGAETVLATLWPVDEWASAALVGRFYREWGGGVGATAAQALRTAQRWLRSVTADELYDLLRPCRDDPGPLGDLAAEVRQSLSGLDGAARPFAHPQCWAGFTVSGR